MAKTQTTTLTNAVVTKYQSDYLLAAFGEGIWAQFVDWERVVEGQGGSSYDWPALTELAPALTALTEDSDVVPVILGDDNLVVTPTEYGNSVAPTQKLLFQSRINIRQGMAKLVGQNMARSVDRLIRNGVLGGSNTRFPSGCTARTDLDTTSDKISYAFLLQLHADAMGADIQPWQGMTFVSVVHPLLLADMMQLTEFKEVQYSHPNEILKGLPGFTFAGFRFIPHKWGKAYLSGGTVAQAATTLASDAAAGATSIVVTLGTGLAAGNYITIGTLEGVDAEEVLITSAAATPTLTIKGSGNKPSNLGLKYAHSAGVSVLEAANAAAIPVIGQNSIKGLYGDRTGRYGQSILKEGLDLLNRFIYQSWYWYGGVGIWARYLVRGEVAVSGGWIGGE